MSSSSDISIERMIQALKDKRPIFHSEADFQHALAWEIHLAHPSASIRLEINPNIGGRRRHLDILARDGNSVCAIELKYKTRSFETRYNDEEFRLQNHGAQDIGRYDFVKDVIRLEEFIASYPHAIGYAIVLTNDDRYWKASARDNNVDALFHLHDGRVLEGELGWSASAGAGTTRGRELALRLAGRHLIEWLDYSKLEPGKNGKFRCVILKINTNAAG
jgi:hypothetical protein